MNIPGPPVSTWTDEQREEAGLRPRRRPTGPKPITEAEVGQAIVGAIALLILFLLFVR